MRVYIDNSDFARLEEERGSSSGVVVMCAGTVVSWLFILHRCVILLPPKESEYISTGDGVKEGLLMLCLLSFMVTNVQKRMIQIYGDNQGAINQLANDPQSSTRSRSIIDVRHHSFVIWLKSRRSRSNTRNLGCGKLTCERSTGCKFHMSSEHGFFVGVWSSGVILYFRVRFN